MVEGEQRPQIIEESVKDHIYRELSKMNPRIEPEKYLELLDQYEEILLHEKQEDRRERLMEKMIGHRF